MMAIQNRHVKSKKQQLKNKPQLVENEEKCKHTGTQKQIWECSRAKSGNRTDTPTVCLQMFDRT